MPGGDEEPETQPDDALPNPRKAEDTRLSSVLKGDTAPMDLEQQQLLTQKTVLHTYTATKKSYDFTDVGNCRPGARVAEELSLEEISESSPVRHSFARFKCSVLGARPTASAPFSHELPRGWQQSRSLVLQGASLPLPESPRVSKRTARTLELEGKT